MPETTFKGTWRLLLPRALAKQSRISNFYSCLKPSSDGIRAWMNNVCLWPSSTCLRPSRISHLPIFWFFKLQTSAFPRPNLPGQPSENPALGQNIKKQTRHSTLGGGDCLRDRKEGGVRPEKMLAKAKWNEEPHTFQKGGFLARIQNFFSGYANLPSFILRSSWDGQDTY